MNENGKYHGILRTPGDLTSWVSLLCFVLSLILSVFYYFSQYEVLYLQVLIAGFILLLPMILNRMGYQAIGTLLLCLLVCLIPMLLSLYNKSMSLGEGIINPVNYFDVRLVVIASIIVPMTTIPLRRTKLLLLGSLPSFLFLALFDPIHNWYGVGYYQSGLYSRDYYFSANLFSGFAFVFLTMAFLFLKSKIERGLEHEKSRRQHLESYVHTILDMGKEEAVLQGRIRDGYRRILEKVTDSKKGFDAAIWDFQEYDTQMVCLETNAAGDTCQTGEVIEFGDYPEYFRKLTGGGIVIQDKRSEKEKSAAKIAEFHKGHPFINVLFSRTGKSYGMLSLTVSDPEHTWTVEDTLFLKATADLISLLHANNLQRRRNAELERHVNERTTELQKTNKELKEYAFLNSHILRAPITRVFGMYQVIEAHYADQINEQIMEHFKLSIEELDNITRKIDPLIKSDIQSFN